MSALVFTCPTTGTDFSSYIHSDVQTVARVKNVPVTLHCPLCGKVHKMKVKDGHLHDLSASPASPQVAA